MTQIPPNINLMAWRAEQQNQQSRRFWVLLAYTAIAAIFVIMITHMILTLQIRQLDGKVVSIQQQISLQNDLSQEAQQIDKEKTLLIPRINYLNKLLNDRQLSIQLLDALSNITPAGIYLTSLSRQDQQITLVGKTVTSAQLAVLLQHLNQSSLFNQAQMNEMKYDNTTPPYQNDFVIVSTLKQNTPTIMETTK